MSTVSEFLTPWRQVEVEHFQGFSRRETGGADAALPAVGLPCRDFALQAGHQVFFVAPVLGPSPLGEPGRRLADTLFVCPETRHCPRYQRKRPRRLLRGALSAACERAAAGICRWAPIGCPSAAWLVSTRCRRRPSSPSRWCGCRPGLRAFRNPSGCRSDQRRGSRTVRRPWCAPIRARAPVDGGELPVSAK